MKIDSKIKVVFVLSLLLSAVGATSAMGSELLLIYQCKYRIVRENGPDFTMVGNIIPSDAATSGNDTTYLTLAPNELSGIPLEARILFTTEGFNPITLHKPGNSATTAAYTTINLGAEAELGYVDENGVTYNVSCSPRP